MIASRLLLITGVDLIINYCDMIARRLPLITGVNLMINHCDMIARRLPLITGKGVNLMNRELLVCKATMTLHAGLITSTYKSVLWHHKCKDRPIQIKVFRPNKHPATARACVSTKTSRGFELVIMLSSVGQGHATTSMWTNVEVSTVPSSERVLTGGALVS